MHVNIYECYAHLLMKLNKMFEETSESEIVIPYYEMIELIMSRPNLVVNGKYIWKKPSFLIACCECKFIWDNAQLENERMIMQYGNTYAMNIDINEYLEPVYIISRLSNEKITT